MKKTIAELLELTRKEQNAYLAILQDEEPKRLEHHRFKAETDRHGKVMVDNLNSNAKSAAELLHVSYKTKTEGRLT